MDAVLIPAKKAVTKLVLRTATETEKVVDGCILPEQRPLPTVASSGVDFLIERPGGEVDI